MAEIVDGDVALARSREAKALTRETPDALAQRGQTRNGRTGVLMAMVLGALLAVVGYCNLAGSADAVLANRYGRALGDAETHWGNSPTANLWLSRIGDQPAVLHKAVTIGDRITVAGASRSDVFEVVGLERIDGEALGQPALHVQVVTARADGGVSSETVRFLFAIETPAAPPATQLPEKVL